MNADAELIIAHIEAEKIAAKHLNFIKTAGERGRSAIADMVEFEEQEKAEPNKYLILKTEYFILSTLVRAMQEELRRMEEEKN